MAMSKSFKQWMLAIILVLVIVMIFDWLFNAHRLQKSIINKSYHQRGAEK
jgi:hypothetical protein